MAGDKKISELIELAKEGVADSDLFAVVNAGETKKLKKSTIFSLIQDLITATTVAFKNSFGIVALIATEALPTTVELIYAKIKMVDATQLNRSNNHMSYSFVNDEATINSAGVYQLNVFAGALIPQNIVVTFAWYLNGGVVPVSAPVEFIGTGNTPVHLMGALLLELSAGDVIDIRAKASSADTDVTILSTQFTLEKTHHQ